MKKSCKRLVNRIISMAPTVAPHVVHKDVGRESYNGPRLHAVPEFPTVQGY